MAYFRDYSIEEMEAILDKLNCTGLRDQYLQGDLFDEKIHYKLDKGKTLADQSIDEVIAGFDRKENEELKVSAEELKNTYLSILSAGKELCQVQEYFEQTKSDLISAAASHETIDIKLKEMPQLNEGDEEEEEGEEPLTVEVLKSLSESMKSHCKEMEAERKESEYLEGILEGYKQLPCDEKAIKDKLEQLQKTLQDCQSKLN